MKMMLSSISDDENINYFDDEYNTKQRTTIL